MHNSWSEIMESECELVFCVVLALGALCHSLVCFWCCWWHRRVWYGGCLTCPSAETLCLHQSRLIYTGAVLNKHRCSRALVAIDFFLGERRTHTVSYCKKHVFLSPLLYLFFSIKHLAQLGAGNDYSSW